MEGTSVRGVSSVPLLRDDDHTRGHGLSHAPQLHFTGQSANVTIVPIQTAQVTTQSQVPVPVTGLTSGVP
jgi:hypothetical protein